MTDKSRSRKALSDQRRSVLFIGRQEWLQTFRAHFDSSAPPMVFAVSGEGGVGKSRILGEFTSVANSSGVGALVITCAEEHTTPIKAMQHIAKNLAEQGYHLDRFGERFQRYQQLREEVERDPDISRDVLSLLARGLSEQTARSLNLPPGPAFRDIDQQVADEALGQLTNSVRNRWQGEEARLLRDPESLLTPLLVELLNQVCRQRPLVLMFDVFEHTADTLSTWLRTLFRYEYGDLDLRLSFVLAGREPLDQYWSEFDCDICRIPLESFTLDETRQYLANMQISDEKLVEQIHSASLGLPALLELLAATRPQLGQDLPDISEDAVKRFLHWTPEPERRDAALLAAVPRQFNRDILAALLGRPADADFAWLNAQSYIRSSARRGRFYHDRVRELMLRYLRNTRPADLEATHRAQSVYFANQQRLLGLEGKAAYESAEWRRLECERVYHTVSMQPEVEINAAVNAFFLALRWRWRFSENIANICQQIVQESGRTGVREMADRLLLIFQAYDQNRYDELLKHLRFFEFDPVLRSDVKCVVYTYMGCAYRMINDNDNALLSLGAAIGIDNEYSWVYSERGKVYRMMGRYDESLVDFDRAIALNPNNTWYIAYRGEVYGLIGRYEEALMDFDKAIALSPNNTWAIASRGQTYHSMKRYEEALADFDRAITLGMNDIWVISSRGQTYRQMKRYKEALVDFDRAIALDANDSWAIARRGQTYREMKRYEDALSDFGRAIELEPNYIWVIENRCRTYQILGRFEEAISDIERILVLDKNNIRCFRGRGEIYWVSMSYEKAITEFNRHMELSEDKECCIDVRGEMYRRLDIYEQALADFTRAIDIKGISTFILKGRAATYRALGNEEAAQADLAQLFDLPLTGAHNYFNRSAACAMVGSDDEAVELLRKAIDLDPIARLYALQDDLLAPLRERPDVQALLAAPPGPPAEPAA